MRERVWSVLNDDNLFDEYIATIKIVKRILDASLRGWSRNKSKENQVGL
jgi:hypothetical protein